jgi:hypothetical protein
MRRGHQKTGRVTVDPQRHTNIIRRAADKDGEKSAIEARKHIQYDQIPKSIANPTDNKDYRVQLAERYPKLIRSYQKIGKIEPIYLGETIYIVGGGPSLNGFNFSSLKDKVTIAVNKSFKYLSNPSAVYWSDTRVYQWYHEELDKLNCLKVTNKPLPSGAPGVVNLLNTGKHGLDKDPRCIRDGGNSGYAAMNLAYHLGAKKIVLLGFDMKIEKNASHFHGGYEQLTKSPDDSLYKRLMLPSFESISKDLEEVKVKVYNASHESAIECFPKIRLDQIFNI